MLDVLFVWEENDYTMRQISDIATHVILKMDLVLRMTNINIVVL